MRKGFVLQLVLGIAAVLVVAIFGFWAGRNFFSKNAVVISSSSSPESIQYRVVKEKDSQTFYNDKLKYKLVLPLSWIIRQEDNSGELFMFSGDGLSIEFQQEATYALEQGQSLENYLDNAPSPAKSQPTVKVKLGDNEAYLQRGIPGGGELGVVTYIEVKHGVRYLPIVIITGSYEQALPILSSLVFYR